MKDREKYLREYYDRLISHKLETQKEYQKVILAISGGSLTVSLTFSDNVISQTGILINLVLVTGWCFLLFCILNQILYYIKVTKSTSDLIEKLEKLLSSDESKRDENSIFESYQKKVEKLEQNNTLTLWTLFVGLILISIYFTFSIFYKKMDIDLITEPKRENIDKTHNIPLIHIENKPIFNNNSSQKCEPNKVVPNAKNKKVKPKKPC